MQPSLNHAKENEMWKLEYHFAGLRLVGICMSWLVGWVLVLTVVGTLFSDGYEALMHSMPLWLKVLSTIIGFFLAVYSLGFALAREAAEHRIRMENGAKAKSPRA
jgi:uncharacterized protein involved in cysteine biosynthesis